MRLFKSTKFKIASLIASTILGVASMVSAPMASADVSLGGPYDNNANAVVWGGASDANVIKSDYNNGDGHNSAASIDHIYNYFHISSADISNLPSDAVAGSVTKSGDVYVGNQLVAQNATTAGREYISGGSSQVSYDGTTFYTRHPSVSFVSDRLSAYVVMQNGQFDYAILSACGNPIVATPVAPLNGKLACQDLMVNPGAIETNGSQSYTFMARATAKNATISRYVFDLDGSQQTINSNASSVTSASKTYAPGNYTVKVTVSGVASSIFATAPSSVTCSKSFTVAANGTLACSALTLNLISTDPNTGNETYSLEASASAHNATITKYVFSFGDSNNTNQTVTTNAVTATSQNFIYSADQTYPLIYVTVYGTGSNGNAVTSGGANTPCATQLSVPSLKTSCNDGDVSNSSACGPTCESSNGQTYPAGSSQCETTTTTTTTTTPTTPSATTTSATQLVNTGPGDTIAMFIGVSLASFFGYRTFLTRKLRHQA